MIAVNVCPVCHRACSPNTKLTWAWTKTGRFVGRGHSSCISQGKKDDPIIGVGGVERYSEARACTWVFRVVDWTSDRARNDALILLPCDALKRAEYVEWWQEGPRNLTRKQVAAIEAALVDVEKEYVAWQA